LISSARPTAVKDELEVENSRLKIVYIRTEGIWQVITQVGAAEAVGLQ
jgi:hypothetical protein